jgi:hypothetical protein
MDIPRQTGGICVRLLDKVFAYTAIVNGICTPLMLFFAAAVFFGWTPSTFKSLGIVSVPVGTAVIALILGVFPWVAVGYAYSHRLMPQTPARREEDGRDELIAELRRDNASLRSREGVNARTGTAPIIAPSETTITPRYLTDLFKGRSELQGQNLLKEHLGTEITVSGKILSIEPRDYVSRLFLTMDHEPRILGYFDISWRERLAALNIGDRITIVGIVSSASQGSVSLDKCKIVSVG